MAEELSGEFARAVLFPVIRRGMGLHDEQIVLTEESCKKLYRIGAQQSILPIIWSGVKDLDIPGDWKQRFDKGCAKDLRAYVLRDYYLGKIREAFDEPGIPYVLLKGSVIRELYPEVWMRTSCDIDILVHEEDLDRAVEQIEAKTDFKSGKRQYHDIPMTNGIISLELHFSIKEDMDNIDSLLSRAWEFSASTGMGTMYRFSPEYQLFHAVAHMSYHMVHGGLGIRPFIDLWLMRKKMACDEGLLREYCASCDLLKFYELACQLADVWMENTPHSETTTLLEDYCLRGGVFGNREQREASRQREKRGNRYLLSRIFVRASFMQELYPELKRKPYLLPIYQIRRWISLLKKDRRKQIRSEIARTNQISRESIEAFDELLTRVGL